MKSRSKFYGITFPFIGLKSAPYDYYVRTDSIGIKLSVNKEWVIIDRYVDSVSMISRYIQTKPDRFLVNATCLNLSALTTKKLEWGIDSKAKIYNLSAKQTFKAKSTPIIKVKDDIFWVDEISYPFHLRKSLIDKKLLLEQYATLIYIDEEWVLHRFTSFKESIKEITL